MQFATITGTVTAVSDITFSIPQGKVVAIVGESGSGKSVTAMSILQLHPITITTYTGSITYNDPKKQINLLTCNKQQLQQLRGHKIAMIFQEPMTALNPVLTCGNQVIEMLQQHLGLTYGDALKKTISLFADVQIPQPEQAVKKYPHQLSGGQKQRVMIAMAMSCNPQLLICDEPTTALDVTVQKNILLLLKQLQKKYGLSILFISHDLGLVNNIADEVIVMYKGKIIEQGSAKQILQTPQQPYTKALLACRPMLYSKGQRLPLVADFMQNPNFVVNKPVLTQLVNVYNTPLFELDDVTIQYPTKHNILGKATNFFTAINKITLTIYQGETLGVVGESGSGKTTLGHALLLLNKASSGVINYEGNNIATLNRQTKKNYRKQVQIIFQDPYSSLNPKLTIGAAISETLLVNKICTKKAEAKTRVLQLLQQVELLPEHYYRYPHEFSGGQRQRIVIARALAMQPSFVVCDESVAALDVSVQAQILNLLNDLKKLYGFTILFISHDLGVVKYISDRIAVMQMGQIVECNTAENIFANPTHEYTKKLLEAIPN